MKQLPGGRRNSNDLNNQESRAFYVSTLKRNIFSNLAGGVWIAALTLVITPIQVNLLGVEAFGLIGFIAILQIVMSVLDLGLSSTITRELAGDTSPARIASRPLIRTALSFYWGIALLIGVVLYAFSGLIARGWFTAETVDIVVLEQGLQVIAIVLALRWPVSLYSGALAGVQRMDILNIVKASVITLRLVGGILVILVWRDLSLFLIWTAFSALVEVLVFQAACRMVMPEMNWRPGFSSPAILAVWRFSLSMNGLGLVAMGITQLDRLLISKILPLESLGYCVLAYTAAIAISMVLSALNTALMPSFAEIHAANAQKVLVQSYHKSCRVTLFTTGQVLFYWYFLAGRCWRSG
jgi:O-antigen/teichoic acid export membrane protein